MALSYKIQSLEARLKKLEKEHRGADSLPAFSFHTNPGACYDVQFRQDSELLIYGGAGTGKTTACLAKIHRLCMDNPGIRVLIVRKTKADLAESVLKAFEVFVLGKGHPLLKGASRYNRRAYIYPNGSRIVLGGMDASTRVMGADYDLVYVSEATEITLEDYEFLSTRLRNNRLPFQQMLLDCNPGSPNHFLYRRSQAGALNTLKSVHKDNPKFWNDKFQTWTKDGQDYLARFNNISGIRYKRLFLGEWTVAEGAIFEDYDPQRHIIYDNKLPVFKRYIGAFDWGHRDAGVMLVFGITREGQMILVHEVYQTKKTLDWWIGQAHDAMLNFKVSEFRCDSQRPENIAAMTLRGIPAFPANKAWEYGIDIVRQALRTDNLKFWHNSLKNPDPELKDYMLPYRLTEEIPGYVRKKDSDRPEPGLADHAIDAMRYACVEIFQPRMEVKPATTTSHSMFGQGMSVGAGA